MKKIKFLALIMSALLSANFVWGDEKSFTITFNDNGSDGSTAVTNSNFINQVTACADSINSVTTAYCFPGTGGLKISSNNNNGSFTLTLKHSLSITKVVLNVKNKNATTKTVTVGSTNFTTSTEFSTDAFIDMAFTGTKTKTDQIYVSLAGTANSKRVAYLASMTIYHEVSAPAPTYTVTAVSNDENLGTVSGTATTITASPTECVGYDDPAYTVAPEGKATVNQSDNTFTVSNVTDNVTITINFAALTPDTYEDHLHNNATIEKCGSYQAPSLDDAAKAASEDCDVVHYHFAGWVINTIISTGTPDAPDGMVTAGTAMNSNGAKYIAVWAKEQ